MDALERLVAIEEIKALKARYFRGLDLKDLDLLRSVFTENVVVDVVGASNDPETGFNPVGAATEAVLHGIDEVMPAMAAGIAGMTSVHQGHTAEIDVQSATEATGIWPMSDLLRFKEGQVKEIAGYGHYYDTYRKISDSWKIAHMRLARLRVDALSR